jgi:Fe-S cluster assembly scaffold protein SufB
MMEIRRAVSSKSKEAIALPEGDVGIVLEIGEGGDLDMLITSQSRKPQQVSLSVIHRGKGKSSITFNSIIRSSLRLDAKLVMEGGSAGSSGKVSLNGIKIGKGAKAGFSPKLVLLDGGVDVSHKSSIQGMPREAIGYLMARGIGKKEAERLFCERFLGQ